MRKNKRKSKNFTALSFITIIAMITLFIAIFQIDKAQHDKLFEYDRVSVYRVQADDTLWSIAQAYSDIRYDTREVIYEIKLLNENMNKVLQIGDELRIPIFSAVKK